MPDRHQVWSCVFLIWASILPVFRTLHYRDFVWLIPVSCIFMLCNHRRTESGMSDVKRGSVCSLVGYWCWGGLYFTGAAVLTDGCPPRTPRRGRHKSFWISLMLYKGLVWTWRLIGHFSKVSRFWWMFEGRPSMVRRTLFYRRCNFKRFEDHVSPHPQGCDVAGGGGVFLQLTKPVSQRLVLVPSPVWDSWPDICFLWHLRDPVCRSYNFPSSVFFVAR
jgi:hypothetical protein